MSDLKTGLYRLRLPTRVRVIQESEVLCSDDGEQIGPVVELKTLMPGEGGQMQRMKHLCKPGDVLVYVSPTGLPTLMNLQRFGELYEPVGES